MKSFQYAIQMEIEGMVYYQKQAENYKGTPLEKIFLLLVKDEEKHRKLLEKLMMKDFFDLTIDHKINASMSVFSDVEGFLSDISERPKQLDVYDMAMGIERKSIALYQAFYDNAFDEREREVYQFLVKQEIEHYELFEKLVTHIGRPETWVEDAEFGPREAY